MLHEVGGLLQDKKNSTSSPIEEVLYNVCWALGLCGIFRRRLPEMLLEHL